MTSSKLAAVFNLAAVAAATAEVKQPEATPLAPAFAEIEKEQRTCGMRTREECTAECYYSERDDACFVSYSGSFEKLFTEWFPSVHYHFFWGLITLLTTFYLLLANLFSHRTMPRFLRNDPGLMSYTFVSGGVVVVLACVGIVAVHDQWNQPGWDSPEIRLTRNTDFGDMVGQIHASYQLWNFAICLLRRDGWISLVHHAACAYLGILNSDGFGCYHLVFMGGVAEISTIILTVMDVFKNNPYLQERYPNANFYTRAIFCGVFLILRVFVWWVVLFWFFSDIYYYLADPAITTKFYHHCYVNLIAMSTLTLIQLVWARLVVLGILRAAGIVKKSPAAGESGKASQSRKSSVSTECSASERKKKR